MAPLITNSGTVLAHVYVSGGALVDSAGNTWTMVGTVPFNAASGTYPESMGPFATANYFRSGTGVDSLDVTGDFTVAVVFKSPPVGTVWSQNAGVLVSNGANGGTGWYLESTAPDNGNSCNIHIPSTAVGAGGAIASGTVNCIVAGRAGTTHWIQLNNQAYVTSAGAGTTAGTANPLLIGTYAAGAGYPPLGSIAEVYFTTNTPTSATFTDIWNQVSSALSTLNATTYANAVIGFGTTSDINHRKAFQFDSFQSDAFQSLDVADSGASVSIAAVQGLGTVSISATNIGTANLTTVQGTGDAVNGIRAKGDKAYSKFYLRDFTATAGFSSFLTASLPWTFSFSSSSQHALSPYSGSGQVDGQASFATGDSTVKGYVRQFISPPLKAATFGNGSWVVNFASKAQSPSLNGYLPNIFGIWICRTGYSANPVVKIYENTPYPTHITQGYTNEQVTQQTLSVGSDVTIQDKDFLVFEIGTKFDLNLGTLHTDHFYYDGVTENTTDGATVTDHASFIQAPVNITLYEADPGVSNAYGVVGYSTTDTMTAAGSASTSIAVVQGAGVAAAVSVSIENPGYANADAVTGVSSVSITASAVSNPTVNLVAVTGIGEAVPLNLHGDADISDTPVIGLGTVANIAAHTTRPILSDDALTGLHSWADQGYISDTKGNVWVMSGSVSYLPPTGTQPEAWQFSNGSYFSSGSGNDAIDTTGSFTTVVLGKLPNNLNDLQSGAGVMLKNGSYGTFGWYTEMLSTGHLDIVFNNVKYETTGTLNGGDIFVFMAGRSGTDAYVRANTFAMVTYSGASTAPDTTRPVQLGNYETFGYPALGGIYEVFFTKTPPSSQLFDQIFFTASQVLFQADVTTSIGYQEAVGSLGGVTVIGDANGLAQAVEGAGTLNFDFEASGSVSLNALESVGTAAAVLGSVAVEAPIDGVQGAGDAAGLSSIGEATAPLQGVQGASDVSLGTQADANTSIGAAEGIGEAAAVSAAVDVHVALDAAIGYGQTPGTYASGGDDGFATAVAVQANGTISATASADQNPEVLLPAQIGYGLASDIAAGAQRYAVQPLDPTTGYGAVADISAYGYADVPLPAVTGESFLENVRPITPSVCQAVTGFGSVESVNGRQQNPPRAPKFTSATATVLASGIALGKRPEGAGFGKRPEINVKDS